MSVFTLQAAGLKQSISDHLGASFRDQLLGYQLTIVRLVVDIALVFLSTMAATLAHTIRMILRPCVFLCLHYVRTIRVLCWAVLKLLPCSVWNRLLSDPPHSLILGVAS